MTDATVPIETPAGYSHPRAECPFCTTRITYIGTREFPVGQCQHYDGTLHPVFGGDVPRAVFSLKLTGL